MLTNYPRQPRTSNFILRRVGAVQGILDTTPGDCNVQLGLLAHQAFRLGILCVTADNKKGLSRLVRDKIRRGEGSKCPGDGQFCLSISIIANSSLRKVRNLISWSFGREVN